MFNLIAAVFYSISDDVMVGTHSNVIEQKVYFYRIIVNFSFNFKKGFSKKIKEIFAMIIVAVRQNTVSIDKENAPNESTPAFA